MATSKNCGNSNQQELWNLKPHTGTQVVVDGLYHCKSCRLGALGNSSTAFRSRDPVGITSFRAHFTSLHSHSSLLTFVFCFLVLFHSFCSHALVFGKTLLPKFHISYSHTEWYLLFSLAEIVLALAEASPMKN